ARVRSISDSAGTFLCLRAAFIWNETEITRLAVEWARYLKGYKHAPLFLPSQVRATLLAGRRRHRAAEPNGCARGGVSGRARPDQQGRSTALGKLVPRGGGRPSSRARACDPRSPRAGRSGARVETGPGGKYAPRGSPRRGPDGRDCPAESGAPPMERAIAERKSPAAERAFILAAGRGSPPGPHPTPSVTRARAGSAPFGGVCDDYLGPVRLRLIRGFAPRHRRQSSLLLGQTELSPDRASARSSAVATGPVTRAAYLPCLGWICCCCWTTDRTTLASWQ